MLQLILTYWGSILAVVAFLAVCIFLMRRGASGYVKNMLLYLVTKAEAEFGGGTGELKYSAVTAWIYEKFPPIVKLFFTAKQLDTYIEAAVKKMQAYLNDNQQAQVYVETGGGVSIGEVYIEE